MDARTARVLLCALPFVLAGCDACSKALRVTKAHTASPPDAVVEEAIRKKLATSAELATKICGVPAGGLHDLEITIDKDLVPGFSTVTVKGKALPPPPTPASAAPDDGPASATPSDGTPSAAPPAAATSVEAAPSADRPTSPGSPAKLAMCAGVMTVMMSSTVDDETVTDWKLDDVTVDEISTPGHEWKRPPSAHHHG